MRNSKSLYKKRQIKPSQIDSNKFNKELIVLETTTTVLLNTISAAKVHFSVAIRKI